MEKICQKIFTKNYKEVFKFAAIAGAIAGLIVAITD